MREARGYFVMTQGIILLGVIMTHMGEEEKSCPCIVVDCATKAHAAHLQGINEQSITLYLDFFRTLVRLEE